MVEEESEDLQSGKKQDKTKGHETGHRSGFVGRPLKRPKFQMRWNQGYGVPTEMFKAQYRGTKGYALNARIIMLGVHAPHLEVVISAERKVTLLGSA